MASSGSKGRVAIAGAGIAGLSSAYYLAGAGFEVDLYEARERAGGLAGSFELDGRMVEYYYHFLCLNDFEMIELAGEIGLADQLRWRPTETTFFYRGKMYGFTSALDLVRFSPIPFWSRINMGLESLKWSNISNWQSLDARPAKEWLIERLGEQTYKVVWEPLLTMKFGDQADQISAAWIWHRVHRVAKSRKTPLSPQVMGHFAGGTEQLITRLIEKIKGRGAKIHLSAAVEKVISAAGKVKGILVDGAEREYDHVILASPLPAVLPLLPEELSGYRDQLSRIDFLGVVCLLVQMDKSISNVFWCNIHDERIPFNGAIDTTILNPATRTNGNLTYIPYYLPTSHPRFSYSDEQLYDEFTDSIKILSPGMGADSIKSFRVFRSRNAQAVCPSGFIEMQPSHRTPLAGLYLIDSTQLYPSDRTLSGTIGLASNVVSMIESPGGP